MVMRLRARIGRRRRGEGDGGYNLVALMVVVTVMNSLVAIALPTWSHIVQRDREEELIFRGMQYAEALRVFQQLHKRPPTRLKELIEVEPRSIRQLWTNPLSEDGSWTLIHQNAGQPGQGGRPGQPGQPGGASPQRPGGRDQPGARPGQKGRPGRGGQSSGRGGAFSQTVPDRQQGQGKQQVTVGPILGVYCKDCGEATKTWMGSRNIPDWKFRADLLTGGNNANQLYNQGHVGAQREAPGATGGLPVIINATDFGRPFPPGVVPPALQGQSGQQGQGGARPGGNARPGQNVGGNAGRPAAGRGKG